MEEGCRSGRDPWHPNSSLQHRIGLLWWIQVSTPWILLYTILVTRIFAWKLFFRPEQNFYPAFFLSGVNNYSVIACGRFFFFFSIASLYLLIRIINPPFSLISLPPSSQVGPCASQSDPGPTWLLWCTHLRASHGAGQVHPHQLDRPRRQRLFLLLQCLSNRIKTTL